MNTENVLINKEEYLIRIYFENRRNSYCSIGRNRINIRIPFRVSREEQFKQILKMKKWAIEKISSNPNRFKKQESKEYKSGGVLKIGDDEFLLHVIYSDKNSSSARIIEKTIFLNISDKLSEERKKEHISGLLSRSIAHKRLPMLYEKIKKLNDIHFQMSLKKIFFKHNRSNWGSCSSRGNINISTRLLFAPDDVLEYVCIHELAHLKEHNHSERFWSLVEKAMPNYKEKELWLKENATTCFF